jgi:two-component system LytT family response regulator
MAEPRVLIVDDEALARRGIRARLERSGGVEIVGECATGRTAVTAIRERSPDIVYLDVQMPGLDGFDVIAAVGVDAMPVVVFVTAYDAHALRAFDVHAVDYLLKPIDDERFARALDRARRAVNDRQGRAFTTRLSSMLAELGREATPPRRDSRLLLKDRGRVVVLDDAEVDWLQAEGDYVRVYTRGKSLLVRERLSLMESKLDPARFARIHRSTIVNVARIRELKPQPNRESSVVLKDGTVLKLSRSFRDALRPHFGDT